MTIGLGRVEKVTVQADMAECRSILTALLNFAIRDQNIVPTLHIETRRLMHAALVPISLSAESYAGLADALRRAVSDGAVGATIDRLGGSILVEDSPTGAQISLRLALAESCGPAPEMDRMRRRLRCV